MNTPNFAPKNIVDEVKNLTLSGLKAVDIAINGKTWHEVFAPLDEADLLLGRALNIHSHLNSVMFDEEFNTQYEKTLPITTDYHHQLSTNKNLYKAFLSLKNNHLNPQESHILDEVIADFELSGLNLTGKNLTRFKAINERLSLLSNEFSKNSLQATNSWTKKIEVEDLGKDYPPELLDKLKKDDDYILSLQMPVYVDVMTYAQNRALRKEIYNAYISRASEVGITDKKYDNKAIMDKILSLRNEKANLLGFENYVQLSLAKKMVESTDEVIDFLNDLIKRIKPKAQKELAQLTKFAQSRGLKKPIQAWDIAFYSEQLKNSLYGFSKTDLLPYFPEEKVLSGLFKLIHNLYGITVSLISEQTYHRDVKVLKLSDDKGDIGKIYLDIYARKNKKGGAWMSDYQGLYQTNKINNKPIAFVVCNLNTPNKDKPALFEFDEIVTIFHEFGHALHHLLTTVSYPSVAGINGVPWDGVELPSQMMEYFCYEKSVIKLISSHYQTGQSLPEALYQKLIQSINFQSAIKLIRQCEFALWDIKTHLTTADCYQTLKIVQTKTALIKPIANNRFLNTFGHIFSGGYAAGYYSYLWAEVLSADAFLYLKSQNFNQKSVSDFRDNILAVGGSADFKKQYQKFRGKIPNINALLQTRGLG